MMNRTSRAWLATESAIHAFRHIDIELRNNNLASLRILLDCHRDAIDRARPVAGEATRTNFQIDVENSPITKWQRILHPYGNAIRVLNRIRLADHVRGSNRHPIENGG